MCIKLFLLCMSLWSFLKNLILDRISHRHDQKPLPREVSGIYDTDRYRSYLQIEHEYRVTFYIESFLQLLSEAAFLFSPFYQKIEALAKGNVYLVVIFSLFFTGLLSFAIELPISYYETFVIDEKHGLNKSTKKEFFKDELIHEGTSMVTALLLYCLIVWICRLIGGIFLKTPISYGLSALIVLCIVGILTLAALGLSLIQLLNLRLKYRFTDLPDGELRDNILAMTKGCKKKIRRIRVYNESAKSSEKNAFLLKFLWYREFGIADNFLEENSQDELLAVLAHETGHLRYKKGAPDHVHHIFSLVSLCALVWLIPNLQVLQGLDLAVRESFASLQRTTY